MFFITVGCVWSGFFHWLSKFGWLLFRRLSYSNECFCRFAVFRWLLFRWFAVFRCLLFRWLAGFKSRLISLVVWFHMTAYSLIGCVQGIVIFVNVMYSIFIKLGINIVFLLQFDFFNILISELILFFWVRADFDPRYIGFVLWLVIRSSYLFRW